MVAKMSHWNFVKSFPSLQLTVMLVLLIKHGMANHMMLFLGQTLFQDNLEEDKICTLR